MKKLIIIGGILLFAITAQAGLFKNSVDLADLSEVPAEKIESLRDSEFQVFLAQVQLGTAKAGERRAAGGVKAAGRMMEAENLDLKAAKAETKAAKANQDQERMTMAGTLTGGAEEDVETAKRLRKWKEQEQKAMEAEVRMAKSALDLAEANRDLARLRLLVEAGAPSASKYDPGEFESSVAKRQKELDKASRDASAQAAKVGPLKAQWERVARNPPPEDSGEE